MVMKHSRVLISFVGLILAAGSAHTYPLDQSGKTGITRLEAYRMAATGPMRGEFLSPGALLPAKNIKLRMLDYPNVDLPAPDPDFTAQIRKLLGADAPRYGVSVLDLSDPANLRYAAVHDGMAQNPGSVGKLMVTLAFFQALADVYPDDVRARERLLKNTILTANGFIRKDSHVVPFWSPGDSEVTMRPIAEGDRANLWVYLDWMCSSSSNAAAAMVQSQLMLLKHFGSDYPVSQKKADDFFSKTPKKELTSIFLDAIQAPVTRNGLKLAGLRQGSFFTREGKRRVPGTSSTSTSRELTRYMLRMEQGRLVDHWSSLEIKRLIYLTERRIRYASSPALLDSALFFKSGSLYGCLKPGGCNKYEGDRMNYLNSVTGVQSTDRKQSIYYVAVVLSNVLRKNSAVEHQALGTQIQRLMEAQHGGPVRAEKAQTLKPASKSTSSSSSRKKKKWGKRR
jgi:hypothetical protein